MSYPRLVNTTQAAMLAQRSVRTVQKWAALGKLIPVRQGVGKGRQNLYLASEVLALARAYNNGRTSER